MYEVQKKEIHLYFDTTYRTNSISYTTNNISYTTNNISYITNSISYQARPLDGGRRRSFSKTPRNPITV